MSFGCILAPVPKHPSKDSIAPVPVTSGYRVELNDRR
jgi:hypothetical protein